MKYEEDRADPYVDKASGILRNLLGIRNQADLDKAESGLSMLRELELRERPVNGNFDLAHLQAIHQRLFGDVYDWAGKIRQVEIQKDNTAFARHMVIESAAKQVFGRLAQENHLKGLDAAQFCARAAHHLGEINVLHPFRDGNGRAQRAFMSQLAAAAGHSIEWSGISQADMVRASIEAYNGSSRYLADLIRAGMAPQHSNLGDSTMSDSTKQRLLVMNGQRLLQGERGGEWIVQKVDKAGALKPGIYDIHLAGAADKGKSYDGVVLFADKQFVYQQVGKSYVKHERQDFAKVPEAGANSNIRYEDGKAIAAPSSLKLGRGLSR
jgi:cell filamentation protein